MEDVNQRYLGSPAQQPPPQQPPPQQPPPQTATAAPSRTPVQTSTSSSRHPPVQSSRSYTTTSSSRQPSSHSSHTHSPTYSKKPSSYSSSHGRTSSYKGKSSSKSGGGWNLQLFKKKETPVEYRTAAPRKPITKHAITKAGDWDKEVYCYAMYSFRGELPCDLQFNKGQRIAIITRTATQNDWWEGTVNGKTGIFPANYVQL